MPQVLTKAACFCHIVHNARNPLRRDPTRTTMIRRRFEADLARRFKRLKAAINRFLVTEDELGLKDKTTLITMAREFQFRTDAGKLTAFNDWFRQQVDRDILSVPEGTPIGTPWTAKYVESAYKMGQLNAYISARAATEQGDIDQSQAQFLRGSFAQPETLSKVQFLATRSFEQLKGVTASMGADMNLILAQGMADGTGVATIAREMAERIDSLTRARAMLIARTEIINAHSEGQLDAFEQLGVEQLGVKAEWSTAGDERVCPLCATKEGQIFTVEEARGMIPLHPNCRCSWIPTVPEPPSRR